MNDVDTMIESYVASWNERDPAARRRIIEETWAPAGIYRNATAEFAGHEGVEAAVTAAHDSDHQFIDTRPS